MKTSVKNLFLLSLLLAALGSNLPGRATAQTFTTLHHFGGNPTDGAHPYAGLVLVSNTLYGTTWSGGSLGSGTVFAVNTNGTSYTNLHHFTYATDGAQPYAGLTLVSNTLIGTTYFGGIEGVGTMFGLNLNGATFANRYNFSGTGDDGANSAGQLLSAGGTLYGTTAKGGSAFSGTVLAINPVGTGFVNLHSFDSTNGTTPQAGLILFGNTLYGTTLKGGNAGSGTVFAVNTNGTGFTNLYHFPAALGPNLTNSNGANPNGGLVRSGNTLYGTTTFGGSAGHGTVFALQTDGTAFTNLHTFSLGIVIGTNDENEAVYANADGLKPSAGLLLASNILYGSAVGGGSAGEGTLFSLRTDGTGFTTLHEFSEETAETNDDGANPSSGLILAGNTLYGTANHAGALGFGTVFALNLTVRPVLNFSRAGNQIVLAWPTNAPGFTLQTTTNLAAVNWSNLSSGITIVGTNFNRPTPMTNAAAFFRLQQ